MPNYEFKFVVSDVKLTRDQEARISQALGQAGSLALAEVTPPKALTVGIGKNIWWRGIPAPDLGKQITAFATKRAGGG